MQGDRQDERRPRDIRPQDCGRERPTPGRFVASPRQMQIASGLSGGISHAFGNILQAVETNLVLAKMAIDDRKRALYLIDQSLCAGRNGAALITKLLAFSRQLLLVPHRVDLNQWLAREAERWADSIGASITVRPRTSPVPVEVVVDEARLTEAVVALVDNAREAMPGGGTLTVSVGWRQPGEGMPDELPPGEYAEIAVSDTGVGMPEQVVSRAIEPFFTTREVGRGSGLGLSMAYGFAGQSGGTVEIQSRVGEGTTVFVLLPAARSPDCLTGERGRGDGLPGRALPAPQIHDT